MMDDSRIYTIFAGINGAGKSTLYYTLGSSGFGERLNSDELLKQEGKDWRDQDAQFKASMDILRKQNYLLEEGTSINRETTFSDCNIHRTLKNIQNHGYKIYLYYVGVDNLELAKKRVKQRVKNGGHGVDPTLMDIRYKRIEKNLIKALPYCDLVQLYDNSNESLKLVAFKDDSGKLVKTTEDCAWLNKILLDLEQEKSYN